MIVKLLTEHYLEFLNLKGGCRGSSESTHVKMPHCWKSHVLAQISYLMWTMVKWFLRRFQIFSFDFMGFPNMHHWWYGFVLLLYNGQEYQNYLPHVDYGQMISSKVSNIFFWFYVLSQYAPPMIWFCVSFVLSCVFSFPEGPQICDLEEAKMFQIQQFI